MKNPLPPILDLLSNDEAIILTLDLKKQILAYMSAADPKFSSLDQVTDLLRYLHQQNVIELSYLDNTSEKLTFIRKKYGN